MLFSCISLIVLSHFRLLAISFYWTTLTDWQCCVILIPLTPFASVYHWTTCKTTMLMNKTNCTWVIFFTAGLTTIKSEILELFLLQRALNCVLLFNMSRKLVSLCSSRGREYDGIISKWWRCWNTFVPCGSTQSNHIIFWITHACIWKCGSWFICSKEDNYILGMQLGNCHEDHSRCSMESSFLASYKIW